MYEQAGARSDLEDFRLMRSMADGLIADWKRLGMEGVYPFPEDMLADTNVGWLAIDCWDLILFAPTRISVATT